jgi:hypothetical protein
MSQIIEKYFPEGILIARLDLKNIIYPGKCLINFLNPYAVGYVDVTFRPRNETPQLDPVVQVFIHSNMPPPPKYRFDFNVSLWPNTAGNGTSTWSVLSDGSMTVSPPVIGLNMLSVQATTVDPKTGGNVNLRNTHDGHAWVCHSCDVYVL